MENENNNRVLMDTNLNRRDVNYYPLSYNNRVLMDTNLNSRDVSYYTLSYNKIGSIVVKTDSGGYERGILIYNNVYKPPVYPTIKEFKKGPLNNPEYKNIDGSPMLNANGLPINYIFPPQNNIPINHIFPPQNNIKVIVEDINVIADIINNIIDVIDTNPEIIDVIDTNPDVIDANLEIIDVIDANPEIIDTAVNDTIIDTMVNNIGIFGSFKRHIYSFFGISNK